MNDAEICRDLDEKRCSRNAMMFLARLRSERSGHDTGSFCWQPTALSKPGVT